MYNCLILHFIHILHTIIDKHNIHEWSITPEKITIGNNRDKQVENNSNVLPVPQMKYVIHILITPLYVQYSANYQPFPPPTLSATCLLRGKNVRSVIKHIKIQYFIASWRVSCKYSILIQIYITITFP